MKSHLAKITTLLLTIATINAVAQSNKQQTFENTVKQLNKEVIGQGLRKIAMGSDCDNAQVLKQQVINEGGFLYNEKSGEIQRGIQELWEIEACHKVTTFELTYTPSELNGKVNLKVNATHHIDIEAMLERIEAE